MGDGVLQFAQHIFSSPGKKDGLYWSNADGGPLSPLGPFVAEAGITQENPRPFSGYYYRILTQQGPAAEGGARNYIVDGRMVLGFALVALARRIRVFGSINLHRQPTRNSLSEGSRCPDCNRRQIDQRIQSR